MKGIGEDLDITKDQHLMSIRKDGECLGHVEIENGKIVTNGFIGENTYDNFVQLIYGLQGYEQGACVYWGCSPNRLRVSYTADLSYINFYRELIAVA